ncbi:hypothetical protein AB2M62_03515 [Sphingomonas sp. MMS12-HWE2-04]|uniref:hypothetical protein n=1 Tax=Sphingomonas sp. MMS12-HWE2-04 TaxID=3234199 RepID=UPI0038507343
MANVMFFVALTSLCCVYALIVGGAPERIATGIVILACCLTVTVASDYRWVFRTREVGIFVVDVAMFLAVLALSLRAERYWPLCMAMLLGLGLLMHLMMWFGPLHSRQITKIVHAWSAYPSILLIPIGAFRHRQRVMATGKDKSWSAFSTPPVA